MRRLMLLIICILPFHSLSAQTDVDFTCLNTNDYRSQLTITPPEISALLPDVSVSVTGRDNYEPVIGIRTSDNVTDCYLSQATLADDTLSHSASGLVYGFGANTVYLSELTGEAGQARVMFEALLLDNEHQYHLNLSQDSADAEEIPTVYLVSMNDKFTPTLSIADAQGNETQAQAVDISELSDFESASSVVSAQLASAGDITLTVRAEQIGVYALIIDLSLPQVAIDDGIATLNRDEDGAISLECDDERLFENGLEVILPDDNDYKATVLANNIDAVLAHAELCYDNSSTASYYFADLPSVTMTPNNFNAQARISADGESIIFGGRDSTDGDYVLIIEGGTLEIDDEGDIFEITLTPQMLTQDRLLRAYVFGIDATLNAILTWEDDAGSALLTCNDAGIAELCEQDLEDFSSASLALGFNQRLLSLSNNPMLEIPVNNTNDTDNIRLRVSADAETFGEYVLVLHMVTD